jgi:hypothetical protein
MSKILINDTIRISGELGDSWLQWMKTVVLPLVRNSGFIESYLISRIPEDDAGDGITFACQFICPDKDKYSDFINNFDPKIQQEQNNRFGGQFGRFRTILEVLEEGKI